MLKSVLILFSLCFMAPMFSQDNKAEIEAYKKSLEEKERQMDKKIEEYCKKNNIPRSSTDEKGNVRFIHHIDENGHAVYYTAKSGDPINIYLDNAQIPLNDCGIYHILDRDSKTLEVTNPSKIKSYLIIGTNNTVLKSSGKLSKPAISIKNLHKYKNIQTIIVTMNDNSVIFIRNKSL